MAEQFLTLSNGAVRHQPYFNSTSDFDYAVTLVDDPTTDTANIVAAAAALNSAGKGKLRLEGVGTLNQGINFTAPISIEMVGKESLLKLAYTGGAYIGFSWGDVNWKPTTATNYTAGAIAAGDAHISSPNLAVSRGEWFVVWSDDAVSGITPHYTTHYPMEIHRALGQDTNDIYFDDFIIDAMSTNVKIVKPPMISGVVVKGLRCEYTGGVALSYPRVLHFHNCYDVVVEDYWCSEDGYGAITAQYCGDVRIQGIVINGSWGDYNNTSPGATYGVAPSVVNGFKFTDSTIRGTRHPFTTSIGDGDGSTYEYSTSRNVEVENVHAQTSGAWSGGSLTQGSRVMFDTHAQTGNITFKNCSATTPGQLSESLINSASFQTRGKNVNFKKCRVFAPTNALATGFAVYGSNCVIDGGDVNNGWYGVKVGGPASDVTIRNMEFRNLYGQMVICSDGSVFPSAYTGNNLTIENNTAINCGRVAPSQVLIKLHSGTGHKIRFNSMPKYSNANAIDLGAVVPTGVEIAGNVMTGYASTPVDADTDIGIVNEMFRDANIYYVGSRQSVHTNVTGAYALDFSTGPTVFLLTLTGDTTPAVTNPLFRGDYTLIVEQDSVERTVTWTGFSFVDGNPTLNAGAGSFTMLRLYFDGINWYSGA